jgi:hypothetical protein
MRLLIQTLMPCYPLLIFAIVNKEEESIYKTLFPQTFISKANLLPNYFIDPSRSLVCVLLQLQSRVVKTIFLHPLC